MRQSVFQSFHDYCRTIFKGCNSVLGSFFSALPYLLKEGASELKKEVTEQYPDPVSSRTAADLPPRTKGLIYNEIDKCTGCKECEKICPVNCIKIETDSDFDPAKLWVSVFDVDHSKCIFCGLCVEVCQPDSLFHTKKFEFTGFKTQDLLERFGRGPVSPEQKEKWLALRKLREEEALGL